MPAAVVVKPWIDPVIDTLGYDPRSWYAESFWLPTLGPTSLLLMRHLADRFDRDPDGCTLAVADTSAALGLGAREGANSPLLRSIARLVQFDLAHETGRGEVLVRRVLPPVNRRHVRRLPVHLQAQHDEWMRTQLARSPLDAARRRARRIAFTLLEQGDDADHVERALQGIGFPPVVSHDASRWAWQRHREALDAAGEADAPAGARSA
jgi:hypothetical protein